MLALFVALVALAENSSAADRSRLDGLYADLKESRSEVQAEATERKIWIEWLKHDEPVITDMMTEALEQIRTNKLKLALATLNQVVEEDPEYAEGWNSRATVLYLLGAYDRSIGDIGRTLALEPRHFGAMAGLGKILIKKGNLKRALQVYRRALKIHPYMVERNSVVPDLERAVEGRGI
tara:strand:+ start:266 stop:802 length:537 start_codon:yes stop_codon:yes gene_type:complete